jgi:hypothetical protein
MALLSWPATEGLKQQTSISLLDLQVSKKITYLTVCCVVKSYILEIP